MSDLSTSVQPSAKQAVISVNIAVILFGLAGLFARWIRLPSILITFGRVLFSSAALGIFLLIRKQRLKMERKDTVLALFAGIILSLHWWSFLESIKQSSVAVGTITFSSFPLFLVFLEPLVFHQRIEKRNVVLAIVILIGVLITMPEFSVDERAFRGAVIGLVSALSYAVLTVVNKIISEKIGSIPTAFIEQATASVILLPFVLRSEVRPTVNYIMLLLLLGVITTAVAHTLFISSLKILPAQIAGICSSLETVYGIIFAALFLGEIPSVREVIGAAVIIGAVMITQIRPAGSNSRNGQVRETADD